MAETDSADDDVICIGSPEPKNNSNLAVVDLTEEADSDPGTPAPSAAPVEISPDPDRVFNTVRDILPHVDPKILRKKLGQLVSDADIHAFVLKCLEEQNHPIITPNEPINLLYKPHKDGTKLKVSEKSAFNPEVPRGAYCIPSVMTTNVEHKHGFAFKSHFQTIPTQECNSNYIFHSLRERSISKSMSSSIVRPMSVIKSFANTASTPENTFHSDHSFSSHVSSSVNQLSSSSVYQLTSSSVNQRLSSSVNQLPSYSANQLPSSSVNRFPSSFVNQLPSSSVNRFPSSFVNQLPSSSFNQLPSSSFNHFPSSSVNQLQSSSVYQLPSSSVNQLPSSSVNQLLSSSVNQLPSSSVNQLPSSSVHQLSSSSVHQLSSSSVNQPPNSSVNQLSSSSVNQPPNSSVNHFPSSVYQLPSSSINQLPSPSLNQHLNPSDNQLPSPSADHLQNSSVNKLLISSVNQLPNSCVDQLGNSPVYQLPSSSVTGTAHNSAADEFYALLEELDLTSFQPVESFIPVSTSVPPPPQSMNDSYDNFAKCATALMNKVEVGLVPRVSAPKSLSFPISDSVSQQDQFHFNTLSENNFSISPSMVTTTTKTPTSPFEVTECVPVPSTSQVVHDEVSQDSQNQDIDQQLSTDKTLLKSSAFFKLVPYSSSVHHNKILPKRFATCPSVIHTGTCNPVYKKINSVPVNTIHSVQSSQNNHLQLSSPVGVKMASSCPPRNRNLQDPVERQTVLVNFPSRRVVYENEQIPVRTGVDQSNAHKSVTSQGDPAKTLGPIATSSTCPVRNSFQPLPIPRLTKVSKAPPDLAPHHPAIRLVNHMREEITHLPGTQPVLRKVIRNRLQGRNALHRHDHQLHAIRKVRNNDKVYGQNQNVSVSNVNMAPNEETFSLLSDILFRADPVNLRKEVTKLKDSDDLDKFLIHSFAVEDSLNSIKNSDGLRSTAKSYLVSRYKILLRLLPDASPTFLKREASKLTSDEELQSFATKLAYEQTYPKRKTVSAKLSKKSCTKDPDMVVCGQENNYFYLTLVDMLPNADPDYLFEQSKKFTNEVEVQDFIIKAVEENNYPKKEQFFKRKEFKKQWKKYIKHFEVKEFLLIFPNPIRHFYIERKNSRNPLSIPLKFLQHRYQRKNANIFGVLYNQTGFSLVRTCDRLDAHFSCKPKMYRTWDGETIFSTSVLQEIAFIQNRREIAHYLLFKKTAKEISFQKAKQEGTLQECGCCYDEKVPDEMVHCDGEHAFCIACVKRGSDVVIGNGGSSFPCYSDGCKNEFPLSVIQNILSPEVFSRLLIRKQYEEVNAAGIPGLESCSFCEFCSIPPPEDKLFHCLNPTCLKISCRSCKKLDHLPLSCEEFARKETQSKMQNYVEEKMTEALVRKCWSCGTKFVKESGCNMMSCKCGAKMCYVCRQPIENYEHFSEGRCLQNFDTNVSDQHNVLAVGKQAKQEIEAANPGFRLENDPTKSKI